MEQIQQQEQVQKTEPAILGYMTWNFIKDDLYERKYLEDCFTEQGLMKAVCQMKSARLTHLSVQHESWKENACMILKVTCTKHLVFVTLSHPA